MKSLIYVCKICYILDMSIFVITFVIRNRIKSEDMNWNIIEDSARDKCFVCGGEHFIK